MIRFSHRPWLAFLPSAAVAALTLVACGAPPPPEPRVSDRGTRGEDLGGLVERYWSEAAALAPWNSWGAADGATAAENIAPQTLADALEIEQRYLAELLAIPRPTLDLQSALTYDIFRRERSLAIEGFTYPLELLPVNPYTGMPLEFALMAPGAERLAMSSDQDHEQWRTRVQSFVRWTQQAIINMRDGVRRGYTVPRVLVEQALPQFAALGEDTPTNVFYQAARPNVGDLEDAARIRLRTAVTTEVAQTILPAYRALHDFLEREYLPHARTSLALSALPLGPAWYAYLVRRAAGTAATPAELHALGLAEVLRLQQRIHALLAEASFSGDARGFLDAMRSGSHASYQDPAELLAAYQALKSRVADAAPNLFAGGPRAEFGIRTVETFRQSVAPVLAYRPRAPNGLIAASLYVNTSRRNMPPEIMPAQYLREAVPGHHYQVELQRERADLPRFRRFGATAAFVEGWGLYAATLGEDLGLYHDPQGRFGSLLAQLNCALGLVMDTGLHSEGWTRQQAVDYLQAQAPLDEGAALQAVERATALPAEALACTVGFLKIEGLRTLAQQRLGSEFDLRAFHAEVIQDGAMPLDLLEAKVRSWLENRAAAGENAGSATTGPAASIVPGTTGGHTQVAGTTGSSPTAGTERRLVGTADAAAGTAASAGLGRTGSATAATAVSPAAGTTGSDTAGTAGRRLVGTADAAAGTAASAGSGRTGSATAATAVSPAAGTTGSSPTAGTGRRLVGTADAAAGTAASAAAGTTVGANAGAAAGMVDGEAAGGRGAATKEAGAAPPATPH